jgi:hypothetical protein
MSSISDHERESGRGDRSRQEPSLSALDIFLEYSNKSTDFLTGQQFVLRLSYQTPNFISLSSTKKSHWEGPRHCIEAYDESGVQALIRCYGSGERKIQKEVSIEEG